MTRIDFQKELSRIIVSVLQVSDPLIRGRIVTSQIEELCGKLDLQK